MHNLDITYRTKQIHKPISWYKFGLFSFTNDLWVKWHLKRFLINFISTLKSYFYLTFNIWWKIIIQVSLASIHSLIFFNLVFYINDFREKLLMLINANSISIRVNQWKFLSFLNFYRNKMEYIKIILASNKSSPLLTVAFVLSYRGRFEKRLLIKSYYLFNLY